MKVLVTQTYTRGFIRNGLRRKGAGASDTANQSVIRVNSRAFAVVLLRALCVFVVK